MNTEAAELIASQALAWLSSDSDRIGVFLGATGLSVGDLAERVVTSEGLAAVMDFILSDDEMVLNVAEHLQLKPEDILSVRQALPGGDLPHWT